MLMSEIKNYKNIHLSSVNWHITLQIDKIPIYVYTATWLIKLAQEMNGRERKDAAFFFVTVITFI